MWQEKNYLSGKKEVYVIIVGNNHKLIQSLSL